MSDLSDLKYRSQISELKREIVRLSALYDAVSIQRDEYIVKKQDLEGKLNELKDLEGKLNELKSSLI
tara:strand:- start:43 stop:243 length:201 start_codon:yes stop_codon:yes gene_type:complete